MPPDGQRGEYVLAMDVASYATVQRSSYKERGYSMKEYLCCLSYRVLEFIQRGHSADRPLQRRKRGLLDFIEDEKEPSGRPVSSINEVAKIVAEEGKDEEDPQLDMAGA